MNYYPKAIEIVTAPGCDHKAVLMEILKHNPYAIVRAVHNPKAKAEAQTTLGWLREVDDFLREGKKISAIKVWRNYTGATLKSAKDEVEKRESELGL